MKGEVEGEAGVQKECVRRNRFGLSLLHTQAAMTSEEARDSKLGFYFLLKEFFSS